METQEVEEAAVRGDAVKEMAVAPPEPKDGRIEPDEEAKVRDATEWLLEAFDNPTAEVTRDLDLNVGSPAAPVWVKWTIRAVAGDELRRIRARAADTLSENAGRKRSGTLADTQTAYRSNIDIIVAGTAVPDLIRVAAARNVADPGIVIEEAFRSKSGLVEQTAAAIMGLSGYDDEDVRDAVEMRAVGNSLG